MQPLTSDLGNHHRPNQNQDKLAIDSPPIASEVLITDHPRSKNRRPQNRSEEKTKIAQGTPAINRTKLGIQRKIKERTKTKQLDASLTSGHRWQAFQPPKATNQMRREQMRG